MPRCYSCGQFVKSPHREFDGRVERAYCTFCRAERDWKLDDSVESPDGMINVEAPPISWWTKLKNFLGI